MQTERSHNQVPDPIQQAIFGLLIGSERQVWAVDDIVREIGDRLAVIDALRDMQAGGVVHRLTDDFVLASRTAVTATELWQ
jgi:hypothetical protein